MRPGQQDELYLLPNRQRRDQGRDRRARPGAVAFLDVSPLADGHVLVVPEAHVARLEDLTDRTTPPPSSAASPGSPGPFARRWARPAARSASTTATPPDRPFPTCTSTSCRAGTSDGAGSVHSVFPAGPRRPVAEVGGDIRARLAPARRARLARQPVHDCCRPPSCCAPPRSRHGPLRPYHRQTTGMEDRHEPNHQRRRHRPGRRGAVQRAGCARGVRRPMTRARWEEGSQGPLHRGQRVQGQGRVRRRRQLVRRQQRVQGQGHRHDGREGVQGEGRQGRDQLTAARAGLADRPAARARSR